MRLPLRRALGLIDSFPILIVPYLDALQDVGTAGTTFGTPRINVLTVSKRGYT